MRGQSNKIRKALRGKKANMTKRKKKKGGKTRRGRKKKRNRSNFKRFTDLNKKFTDLMEKVSPYYFFSIYWKDVDCYITIPDK